SFYLFWSCSCISILSLRDALPIWARRSHGIVAGEPKSFKSTYVMDLAISVASGEPFLGKYPVIESGPVIYVQNENADWILKDRIDRKSIRLNSSHVKISYAVFCLK